MGEIYVLMGIVFFIVIVLAILIIKFGLKTEFLLAKVTKRITDGYVIFNTMERVTNFNSAFLYLFDLRAKEIKNRNIKDVFKISEFSDDDIEKLMKSCEHIKNSDEKVTVEIKRKREKKVFRLELMCLFDNDDFSRYVIIVKDVTKNYEMLEELRTNQDMMANRERFATLGQLISGIVHSLKSPIFAITRTIRGTYRFNRRI